MQSLCIPLAQDATSASEFRPRAETEHDRKIDQEQQGVYRVDNDATAVGIDKYYDKRGSSGNEISLYAFTRRGEASQSFFRRLFVRSEFKKLALFLAVIFNTAAGERCEHRAAYSC